MCICFVPVYYSGADRGGPTGDGGLQLVLIEDIGVCCYSSRKVC